MAKKKDKPLTESAVRGIVREAIEELAGIFEKVFRRERQHNDQRFDKLEKEIETIKIDRKQDWQEQREFNERIEKKVDMLDESVQTLDKRVQYPADAPVRLEQAENDIHDLKRRVFRVEEKVK